MSFHPYARRARKSAPTPPTAAGPSRTPRSAERGEKPFKGRNRWEQKLYETVGGDPAFAPLYNTDAELDEFLLMTGTPREELAAKRKWCDDRMNRWLDLNRGEVRVWGLKPGPKIKGDVHVVPVPDAGNMSVRFFDGGLKLQRAFVLDFYDTATRKAVNSPSGWIIHISPMPGTLSMACAGPLASWEASRRMKRQDIPDGEERFSMPEGCVCHLERPGRPPFWFAAPKRETEFLPGVVVAQPQLLV